MSPERHWNRPGGRQTEDTELRALQGPPAVAGNCQADFEGAQEELLSAQASLDAAEAALATAEDALSYTELKADADGIITARDHRSRTGGLGGAVRLHAGA